MSMTVIVGIDQAQALRQGKPLPRYASVTISDESVAQWSESDRSAVAGLVSTLGYDECQTIRTAFGVVKPGEGCLRSYYASYGQVGVTRNDLLTVPEASVPAILGASLASLAKATEAAASYKATAEANLLAQAARYAEADAKLAGGPVEKLLELRGGSWAFVRPQPQESYPLTYARQAEAETEAQARNEAAEASSKAEKARKAEQMVQGLAQLREWVLANGSALSKARLEEGYESWASSAREEYADFVAAQTGLQPADELGESKDLEDRKCPTLEEIEALRAAREKLPEGVKAELVRFTYSCENDYEEESDVVRVELMLTIPHPTGDMERYLLLPAS